MSVIASLMGFVIGSVMGSVMGLVMGSTIRNLSMATRRLDSAILQVMHKQSTFFTCIPCMSSFWLVFAMVTLF